MTKRTDTITTANIGLAIWRLKCFNEKFVEGSTLGILLNFCTKNKLHRQAEKRQTDSKPKKKSLRIENLEIFKDRSPNINKKQRL
jgi:hypothetical protein